MTILRLLVSFITRSFLWTSSSKKSKLFLSQTRTMKFKRFLHNIIIDLLNIMFDHKNKCFHNKQNNRGSKVTFIVQLQCSLCEAVTNSHLSPCMFFWWTQNLKLNVPKNAKINYFKCSQSIHSVGHNDKPLLSTFNCDYGNE